MLQLCVFILALANFSMAYVPEGAYGRYDNSRYQPKGEYYNVDGLDLYLARPGIPSDGRKVLYNKMGSYEHHLSSQFLGGVLESRYLWLGGREDDGNCGQAGRDHNLPGDLAKLL